MARCDRLEGQIMHGTHTHILARDAFPASVISSGCAPLYISTSKPLVTGAAAAVKHTEPPVRVVYGAKRAQFLA